MHRCQLFCHNQEIYLNEYMQVAKHYLFHDGSSCRIKTGPLICSADHWTGFCIIGTSFMKDSIRSSSTYSESLFLRVVRHNLLFFVFVFYLAFLSQIFMNHRTAGEEEGFRLICILPLPPALQTLRQ